MRNETTRFLGLDISLSCPGFCVIEVRNRQPILKAVTHVKTSDKEPYHMRTAHIEAAALLFFRQYQPYDAIIREAFAGKIPLTNYSIFSAWNAVDRALGTLGYVINPRDKAVNIPQQTVKKTLLGSGKAEKYEVEAGVRRYLALPEGFTFKTSDESDSCAIVLAYLLAVGEIDAKPAE